jgi:hypothetical protein
MRRLSALLLLLTSGCAGSISVVPVANDMGSVGTAHRGDPGAHFFAPAPYALITTTKPTGSPPEPGYTIEIVYLPDPSREYAIQWSSGMFGTINPNFTLDRGWNLVGFNSAINTGLSASLALQGQGSLTRAIKNLVGTTSPVGLYKLNYNVSEHAWELGKKVLPDATPDGR